MASVDSGVETSNDSNDSSVTHGIRSHETSPVKLLPDIRHVCAVQQTVCPVHVPSCSSTSEEMDQSKEKNLGFILPEQKTPIFDFDPPPGLSFCNPQPTYGSTEGCVIISTAFDRTTQARCIRPRTNRYSMRYRKMSPYHDSWRRYHDKHRPDYDNSQYRRSSGTNLHSEHIQFHTESFQCRSIDKYLLSKDNSLQTKRYADQRRLWLAASTNNEEQVATLLNLGVSPNCHDQLRRTPLHQAACRGFTNVVRLLLENQANANAKDSLGNTPLHLAACTNHVEVVTLLLKAGTDVTSNDSYGRNPLQLAQSRLKLLQKGSDNEDSLKIKQEVQKVIEMMYTFLYKNGQDAEAELLNAFQTRLTLSQTKEEVATDVHDLLASLGNLNLNKTDAC